MNSWPQSLQVRVLSVKLIVEASSLYVADALSTRHGVREEETPQNARVDHSCRRVSLAGRDHCTASAALTPSFRVLFIAPWAGELVRWKGARKGLAEPFIEPFARAETRARIRADLGITRLLVRAPAALVRERDPVVRAMEAHLLPDECHTKPHRLARDALAVEIVAPDEDAGLAVAARPADVKESGEADGLALVGDRPRDAVVALEMPLEPLLGGGDRLRCEPRTPEARDLRLHLPLGEELVVLERRWAKLDAVIADDARSEHQRDAPSGTYSRSVIPKRSSHTSRCMTSQTSSTYVPSR